MNFLPLTVDRDHFRCRAACVLHSLLYLPLSAELGEDALAFVAGKASQPSVKLPMTAPLDHQPDIRGRDSVAVAPPQNEVPSPKPRDAEPIFEGIVSITVRLPSSLPLRLLRASVERKLQRKHPFTQQDIVAEALQQWLTQNAGRAASASSQL
jgi:hypothetical protein